MLLLIGRRAITLRLLWKMIVNCQIPTDRPLFEQAFSQFVVHHERTQSGQKTGQNNGHIANQNRIN
ncbi:MAG: hypothetical protein K9L32_15480 [Chromatiaceae bacterium]|nr:hypothetical protein [Chromatiaceae bacterium]